MVDDLSRFFKQLFIPVLIKKTDSLVHESGFHKWKAKFPLKPIDLKNIIQQDLSGTKIVHEN
jgi:hypothetical protein